jgi:hypothetical protein
MPVGRRLDAVALQLQATTQDGLDLGIVVNDEDARPAECGRVTRHCG